MPRKSVKASTKSSDIQFSYFKTRFRLPSPKKTIAWIDRSVAAEKGKIQSLAYVFCSDEYLWSINQDYLNHDTLTDIITFDYSEKPDSRILDGEIYISIPRVRENASELGNEFDAELHRVIIHGVLHLLGYSDKTGRAKSEMRKRESAYLSLR